MDLGNFILDKIIELEEEYKQVKFKKSESVVLSKNSVSSEFNSKETSLLQIGREVNLSELDNVPTLPFIPNGSVVSFEVKPPKKRNYITKQFYFFWS